MAGAPRPIVPPPGYSFTLHSQQFPTVPHKGDRMDAELEQLRITEEEIIEWLCGVVDDDGGLVNYIVLPDNLSSETMALITNGWNPRGEWAPTTGYLIGDFVVEAVSGNSYVAAVDHTSTADFTTDFNAGYWTLVFKASGGSRRTIMVNGAAYPDRDALNFSKSFIGADDSTNNRTDISLNFGTEECTVAEGNHRHDDLYALIDHFHPVFTATENGFVPAPGNQAAASNASFLRADGVWNNLLLTGGLPVGGAIPFTSNTTVPQGWILCDGRAVSRTEWPELSALYESGGWPYGAGDGSTTFNVPDYRGRSVIGAGQGDTEEGGAPGTNYQVGQHHGSESYTLQNNEIPASTVTTDAGVGLSVLGPSAAQPHYNTSPAAVETWIVKGSATAAGTNGVLGEINAGTNLGTGVQIYAGKGSVLAENLDFRTLISSDNSVDIRLGTDPNEIDLRTLGGGGGASVFTDLLDTPPDYTSATPGDVVIVAPTGDALIFSTSTAGDVSQNAASAVTDPLDGAGNIAFWRDDATGWTDKVIDSNPDTKPLNSPFDDYPSYNKEYHIPDGTPWLHHLNIMTKTDWQTKTGKMIFDQSQGRGGQGSATVTEWKHELGRVELVFHPDWSNRESATADNRVEMQISEEDTSQNLLNKWLVRFVNNDGTTSGDFGIALSRRGQGDFTLTGSASFGATSFDLISENFPWGTDRGNLLLKGGLYFHDDIYKWNGVDGYDPISFSGEANTQSNQGGGAEIGLAKAGVDLPLRTLVSGDASVIITQHADTIDLQATGAGGGESNTQSNQGGGIELGLTKNGVDLPLRTLVSSDSSVVLVQNAETVGLTATAASVGADPTGTATAAVAAHEAAPDPHTQYLTQVVEDTTPVLGGNLETKGNGVLLTRSDSSIRAVLAAGVSVDGGFLAYTRDGTYSNDDGGVSVEPGTVQLYGNAVSIPTLRHSLTGGRQVYVSDNGLLYGQDPPPTGWTTSDTSTTTATLGTGDTTGPWVDTGITLDIGADVEIGQRLDVSVNVYIENRTDDKAGNISIGFGINGADPTGAASTVTVGEYFEGWVPVAFSTVAGQAFTTTDDLDIFVRRESSSDSSFNPWLAYEGAEPHEGVLSTPGGSAGGGGGDVLQGTGGADGEVGVWSSWSGKLIGGTGLSAANIPTMASAAAGAGNLLQSAGADKSQSDSGVAVANVPTQAANGTSGNLLQSAGNDKTQSDSGIATADVPTMASAAAGAGNVIQSAGADKTQADTGVAVTALARTDQPTTFTDIVTVHAPGNSGFIFHSDTASVAARFLTGLGTVGQRDFDIAVANGNFSIVAIEDDAGLNPSNQFNISWGGDVSIPVNNFDVLNGESKQEGITLRRPVASVRTGANIRLSSGRGVGELVDITEAGNFDLQPPLNSEARDSEWTILIRNNVTVGTPIGGADGDWDIVIGTDPGGTNRIAYAIQMADGTSILSWVQTS